MSILSGIVEKKWDLEIFAAVRSDYLAKLSDADFEVMKKAGIVMVGIGVESGSQKTLDRIQKKEPISATFEASKRLKKHKIRAWYHFLYGFPDETLDDFLETYHAMCHILDENPNYAQVNLNKLIPTPQTPIFEACKENGFMEPFSLEEWANIVHQPRPYIPDEINAWVLENLAHIIFPTSTL